MGQCRGRRKRKEGGVRVLKIEKKQGAVELHKDLTETVIVALPQLIDELENLAQLCETINRSIEAYDGEGDE